MHPLPNQTSKIATIFAMAPNIVKMRNKYVNNQQLSSMNFELRGYDAHKRLEVGVSCNVATRPSSTTLFLPVMK